MELGRLFTTSASKRAYLRKHKTWSGVHKLEFGGRWLDRGAKCTELNITSTYGRIAIITLEDDGNWGIIVAGNVRNGWNRYDVDSSKDFDVRLTDDGAIELKVRNGNWNPSQGALIRLDIIPFVR